MATQKKQDNPFWRAYATWDNFMVVLEQKLKSRGYMKSKPAMGSKKKKVLNLWYDEATGEIVIETE